MGINGTAQVLVKTHRISLLIVLVLVLLLVVVVVVVVVIVVVAWKVPVNIHWESGSPWRMPLTNTVNIRWMRAQNGRGAGSADYHHY